MMVNKKEKFIKRAIIAHGNKYDYSLVDYINDKTKVKIICSIHGIFEQQPNNHTNSKQNCPKCNDVKKLLMCHENNIKKNLTVKDNFITEGNLKHNNKYNYSLVNYIDAKTKVKIICPIHGVFEQQPLNHKSGCGCPTCNESKGEREIRVYLTDKNINHIAQKTFDTCKDKRKLPFDFYLPDYNTCIEFNGRQHYEVIDRWDGLEGLKDQQKKDKIKNDYCLNNDIKLIVIKHDESIKEKLQIFQKT